jgi:sensor c-di-GMP phosphodiesterase-like protein
MQILFEDMGKLRSMGFKVSIDDFGIGYSTLSVLMKAPVDIVKIDKSFIDNLTRSRVDREFLNNMCKLIETVNKDVIFEGVESEEQAQILSSSGHTKAQGWLFDKAIPLKRFNEKYMY